MGNIYLNSRESNLAVRYQSDTCLLAFSTGKDAIGAWLELREVFSRIEPYYLYLVPGLEFVEDSLTYYERFFGQRIRRLPHPWLYAAINYGLDMPEWCRPIIKSADLPSHSYADIRQVMIEDLKLGGDTFVADGVRAADSPMRRISIQTHGPISQTQKKFHAIWDWKKEHLVSAFARSGVRLPVDYKVFGRTFDGTDLRFLLPMKKYFPRDYQKLLEWFPFVEAEIRRYEYSIS